MWQTPVSSVSLQTPRPRLSPRVRSFRPRPGRERPSRDLAELFAEVRALRAVVESLAARLPVDAPARGSLVDAATLADELGVHRSFVYQHREMLGAIRLGAGPKAPLRFDVEAARQAMACLVGRGRRPASSAMAGSRDRRRAVRDGRREEPLLPGVLEHQRADHGQLELLMADVLVSLGSKRRGDHPPRALPRQLVE
jgi:hypothetical protein